MVPQGVCVRRNGGAALRKGARLLGRCPQGHCEGFVYAGMMYTVPKVFEIGLAEARPDSYTGIGILTGAVIGLSSVCSYVGGWLAERYSPRWVYLVFWALLIPALVVVTVTVITF